MGNFCNVLQFLSYTILLFISISISVHIWLLYYHLIRCLFLSPYIIGILISLFQKWNPIHWPHILNNLLTSVYVTLCASILCILSNDSESLLKLFWFLWIWWFFISCFIGLNLEIEIQIIFISYFKFPGWLHTE